MIPHNVSCSLSVFQILTLYSSNLLRLGWKPCGAEDESIDHKIHFLVESSINTHLIQTIFFSISSWRLWCYCCGILSLNIYICTCKRFISCLLFWKDLSANISRSPFIKLSVYSIRFVIIKTFIKKIFGSTASTWMSSIGIGIASTLPMGITSTRITSTWITSTRLSSIGICVSFTINLSRALVWDSINSAIFFLFPTLHSAKLKLSNLRRHSRRSQFRRHRGRLKK